MLCLVSLSQLFSGAIWKPFDGKFDGPFGIAFEAFFGSIFGGKMSEGNARGVAIMKTPFGMKNRLTKPFVSVHKYIKSGHSFSKSLAN